MQPVPSLPTKHHRFFEVAFMHNSEDAAPMAQRQSDSFKIIDHMLNVDYRRLPKSTKVIAAHSKFEWDYLSPYSPARIANSGQMVIPPMKTAGNAKYCRNHRKTRHCRGSSFA